MSNPIQFRSFDFNSNAVRVIIDPNQEPWFCGTDVCEVLGYVNAPDALKKHCKQKGIAKRYTLTEKGNQELTYINEPNLYRLIIKSRKPEAERFEAWVFEEVLPQIRKTGQYSQNVQPMLPLAKGQNQPSLPIRKPDPTHFTLELKDYEFEYILWAMFALSRGLVLFDALEEPLHKICSAYSPNVASFCQEYAWVQISANEALKKATKKVELQYDCDLKDLFDFMRKKPEEQKAYHERRLREQIARRT